MRSRPISFGNKGGGDTHRTPAGGKKFVKPESAQADVERMGHRNQETLRHAGSKPGARLIEETPAKGRLFSSPQAAANDVAGMGIKGRTFLDGINRSPDAVVLPVVAPGPPKRQKRNLEAAEEPAELD